MQEMIKKTRRNCELQKSKTLLLLIPYTYNEYYNVSVATNDVNAMNNSASCSSEHLVESPTRDS